MIRLSGVEQAILADFQLPPGPGTDAFPVVRVTVYDAPAGRRATRKRRADPAETGEAEDAAADARQAFWQAHGSFVRAGERTTPERVSRWIRQLVGLDLGALSVEDLKAIGWEARVLIWMRHHRLGYQCPFHRTCARTGPQGDCLSPVSLPLLSEIQRTLRRLPDVAVESRKKVHLKLVSRAGESPSGS